MALAWARERSGFTLLFEALVMALVREMPVAAVAGLIGEHDTKVWRVVHHYVEEKVQAQYLEGVERVRIDETSSRRGHDYVVCCKESKHHRELLANTGYMWLKRPTNLTERQRDLLDKQARCL